MEQSFNKSAAFEPRRFFGEAAQYKGRTYNAVAGIGRQLRARRRPLAENAREWFNRLMRNCTNEEQELSNLAPKASNLPRVASRPREKHEFYHAISWQEWQGSNLRPPVLETGALPIELHSCTNQNASVGSAPFQA
jgi:hypothetical protein